MTNHDRAVRDAELEAARLEGRKELLEEQAKAKKTQATEKPDHDTAGKPVNRLRAGLEAARQKAGATSVAPANPTNRKER